MEIEINAIMRANRGHENNPIQADTIKIKADLNEKGLKLSA